MTEALPKQGLPLMDAAPRKAVLCTSVPPRGLETDAATSSPGNDLRNPSPAGAARSGAVTADPNLARVIDAWPGLPPHVRAAVLALVGGAVV